MTRLVVFALMLSLYGCDELSHSCTDIGCNDGASITLRTDDWRWREGVHEIDFTFGGQTRMCSLRVPEDIPEERGRSVDLLCSMGFSALLIPRTRCMEVRTADAISQSCEEVPGQSYVSAGLQGVVASLRVEVRRDGATIFDRTVSPEYRQERPNGPDCEPICQLAEVELTIE
jgi:hypothetical protein